MLVSHASEMSGVTWLSLTKESNMTSMLTKHSDTLYTVGNYKLEYFLGDWYLNGNQIESVRSYDKDTLIKIACYLTNVEQQADLIRQMFELSIQEKKEESEKNKDE